MRCFMVLLFFGYYFYIVWVYIVTRCMAVLENGRNFTGLVFFDPGTSRHIADEGRVIGQNTCFFVSNFALRLGIFYTKCLCHNK